MGPRLLDKLLPGLAGLHGMIRAADRVREPGFRPQARDGLEIQRRSRGDYQEIVLDGIAVGEDNAVLVGLDLRGPHRGEFDTAF